MEKTKIPKAVRVALWSYDTEELDLKKHKRLIIKNVLDYGTREATDWLFKMYSEDEIKKVIENSCESEWGKKSLNYWSLIFGVKPKKKSRF